MKRRLLPVIDRYAKMTGAFRDARYWNLTLDFGRRYTKMVLDWCEAALSSLNQTRQVSGRRLLQKGSSFQQKRSRR